MPNASSRKIGPNLRICEANVTCHWAPRICSWLPKIGTPFGPGKSATVREKVAVSVFEFIMDSLGASAKFQTISSERTYIRYGYADDNSLLGKWRLILPEISLASLSILGGFTIDR